MSKLSVLVFFFGIFAANILPAKEANKKTIINSVSPAQVQFLRKVDKKYKSNHGIHIQLKKTVISETLGTEKNPVVKPGFSTARCAWKLKVQCPQR